MMQRSPVNFWLLLAATAAVDAVAVYWGSQQQFANAAAGTLYDALSFGQLSLLSMWAVFAARRQVSAAALLVGAVLVVAAVTAQLVDLKIWETAAVYGSHVTAMILILWAMKQSRFWRGGRLPRQTGTWQFSVAQLLALMTVVALLSASLRSNELTKDPEPRGIVIVAVAANIAVSVFALALWARPWHVMLRLAATLAMAGVVGLLAEAWALTQLSLAIEGCLLEVVVIFAWLEIGQIIPRVDPSAADGSPPEEPEPIKSG